MAEERRRTFGEFSGMSAKRMHAGNLGMGSELETGSLPT